MPPSTSSDPPSLRRAALVAFALIAAGTAAWWWARPPAGDPEPIARAGPEPSEGTAEPDSLSTVARPGEAPERVAAVASQEGEIESPDGTLVDRDPAGGGRLSVYVRSAEDGPHPPGSVHDPWVLIELLSHSGVRPRLRWRMGGRSLASHAVEVPRNRMWIERDESGADLLGRIGRGGSGSFPVERSTVQLTWGAAVLAESPVPDPIESVTLVLSPEQIIERSSSVTGECVLADDTPWRDGHLRLVHPHGERELHVGADGRIEHAELLAPGDYWLVAGRTEWRGGADADAPLRRLPVIAPRRVALRSGATLDVGRLRAEPGAVLGGWCGRPRRPDDGTPRPGETWSVRVSTPPGAGPSIELANFDVEIDTAFRIEGLGAARYGFLVDRRFVRLGDAEPVEFDLSAGDVLGVTLP